MVTYIRDYRSPRPKSHVVSRVMSANRAKGTNPEVVLRKRLHKFGLAGYRLQPKGIIGRPDIVYKSYRLALFINGCFWHHCRHCNFQLPKTNRPFWKNKFLSNQKRDARNIRELKRDGWKVFVIWEHEIKKDPDRAAAKILRYIKGRY